MLRYAYIACLFVSAAISLFKQKPKQWTLKQRQYHSAHILVLTHEQHKIFHSNTDSCREKHIAQH